MKLMYDEEKGFLEMETEGKEVTAYQVLIHFKKTENNAFWFYRVVSTIRVKTKLTPLNAENIKKKCIAAILRPAAVWTALFGATYLILMLNNSLLWPEKM